MKKPPACTLAPPGTDALAEFKINLLAPALGDGFLACGRVLRPGRTLTVCQARCRYRALDLIVRPADRGGAASA
jgi:acyl-coenzyme A thioesterase PaaI-like protein